MTKSDISQRFSELRKAGALVKNLQSKKSLPASAKGLSDLTIIYKGKIWFVEIKMKNTKDKLSNEQAEFRDAVLGVKKAEYREANEENCQLIINEILK